MSDNVKYVDVILPLPLKGRFTYSTDRQDLVVGQRVIVQFGQRKLYTGLIHCVYNNKLTDYEVKPLLAVLDEPPLVNPIQIRFWEWIADYYMCDLGDVMNTALPSSFKLASESKVTIHSDFDGNIACLQEDEIRLLEILADKDSLNINQISKILDIQNVFIFINKLLKNDIIQIKEDLFDKYKPKKIRVVNYTGNTKMLQEIRLTEKQELFIQNYLNLVKQDQRKEWIVSDLLKNIGFSNSIFNTLIKKGVFSVHKKNVSRLLRFDKHLLDHKRLIDFQNKALQEIKLSFMKKKVCLLHGVTSSGKTELYIHLIREELKNNKQVLYLLPEIALTTQIIKRLQQHFGDQVGVTHSNLNNSERVEVWRAVQEKNNEKTQYPIILGARSSLFLPFSNLGLIIIDEEHDASFKQNQLAPRYHARDAAIYLAKLHKSKVLLGSATPSVESYYNAKKNKYGLVEMNNRFLGIPLPKVDVIDLRKAYLKKKMTYQFSPQLIAAMNEALNNQKQVILFQNRRGFAPIFSCNGCGYTPECVQCDVTLTYHKWNNHLKCHYCGYTQNLPTVCSNCKNKEFSDKGFGTEQIEQNLKELFPNNIIKRMDYDTTRGKKAYEKIICDFEEGRTDILVGTQMITKGLDFDNVSVVGILNADSMLNFPDFRAYERAFQLMMQVAGRAGRKGDQGKVLIQTYNEDYEIFTLLKENDFSTFVKTQFQERKTFDYPPFNRIINISLRHKDQRKLEKGAFIFASMMRKSFEHRVLGPEYPLVSRIRNYYHKNLMLKVELTASVIEAKNILTTIIENTKSHIEFKSLRFVVDIDPV